MGVLEGFIHLYAVQFLMSTVLWIVYDLVDLDIMGTVAIKQMLSTKGSAYRAKIKSWKVSRYLSGTWLYRLMARHLVGFKRFAWLVEFLLFSWQLTPFLALICLRKNGIKGPFFKEAITLLVIAAVSTAWWTFVWTVLIKVAALCKFF